MTEKEYNDCVALFSDKLFRFLLQQSKSQDDAKDLVQESFVKLWENKAIIRKESAKSFLFKIGYHRFIDGLRRDKKMINKIPHSLTRKDDVPSFEIKDVLHIALEQLPEIQKSVVLLRDYEGYAYKEIGEILNLSEQQVKVYIFRARTSLKKYIGDINHII